MQVTPCRMRMDVSYLSKSITKAKPDLQMTYRQAAPDKQALKIFGIRQSVKYLEKKQSLSTVSAKSSFRQEKRTIWHSYMQRLQKITGPHRIPDFCNYRLIFIIFSDRSPHIGSILTFSTPLSSLPIQFFLKST